MDRSSEKEPVTSFRSQVEPSAGKEHAQGEKREDPGADTEGERGLGGACRTITHVTHPDRKDNQEQQQDE